MPSLGLGARPSGLPRRSIYRFCRRHCSPRALRLRSRSILPATHFCTRKIARDGRAVRSGRRARRRCARAGSNAGGRVAFETGRPARTWRGAGRSLADRRGSRSSLGALIKPFDIDVASGAYWLVARNLRDLSEPAAAFADWLRSEFAEADGPWKQLLEPVPEPGSSYFDFLYFSRNLSMSFASTFEGPAGEASAGLNVRTTSRHRS